MKIGIVVDNYKLPMFRKKLTEAAYIFEEKPFTKTTSAIFIMAPAHKEIEEICRKVERETKHI